jgi:hypothetical protein
MGDHPDEATAALRHVRLRLGTAEDGLDRAIVGCTTSDTCPPAGARS